MSFQRPKGTNDILPGESEKWQFVEETARLLFRDYQYNECVHRFLNTMK